MSSALAIRKHRSVESFKVCQLLVGTLLFWQFRRPETWLAFAASLNAHALARMGGVHPHTTHADWHAWEWQGLVAPRQRPPTSAPPRIPAAPLELLVHLAEQWPATVVQLYGRRSLTKLRTAVSGQRLARAIRREYRRRRLGKRGGRFLRKRGGTDPRRRAILRRLRSLGRHRPRRGVLLFFDVQPITAKAYGGRRSSAAARRVQPSQQKTRGRFDLLLAYKLKRGIVPGYFQAGKGATSVYWIMRRARHGYRGPPVRVALGRDSPHPCKAQKTRRVMQTSELKRTSWPKGSRDDNVAATNFSDILLMIRDNSNDPDGPTSRQNRRRDRRSKIGYLPGTHK